MYTEYTLEEHLKSLCNDYPQYKHLYASLELDKIEISKVLTEIIFNTPHFSDHEISHSESIINKIQMLLGRKRIEKLEPTETWLIIMAAYTHDLGMVIFHEQLKKDWKGNELQEFISENSKESFDPDLQRACSLLKDLEPEDFTQNLLWPVEVKHSVNMVISSFYRKNHAKNSMFDIEKSSLNNNEKLFLVSNVNVNRRIIKLLAQIAYSHSWSDFKKILNNFPYQTNGCINDKIHPRFISCLLRIGDLLDLDNNRFNKYNESMIGNLPKISQIHKDKHESITHFLVTPSLIEISAECKNSNVYRELRSWIDMLHKEINNISINWNSIAPQDFNTAPQMGKVSLTIEDGGELVEQADLQFHIETEKAFNIIEGSGIYENRFVFIRELLQNALDSTKLQMWKDLNAGQYRGSLLKDDKPITLDQLKKSPHYLNQEIYNNYPITITLDIETLNKDMEDGSYYEEDYNIVFTIKDCGTGISNKDLERISSVGSSYKTDIELRKLINDLPFYLKPTAAFGLGLQSCFLVTDKINARSKSDGEPLKEIEMCSRSTNGYLTVEHIHQSKTFGIERSGTTFRITIGKAEVEKLAIQGVRTDPFASSNQYLIYLKDHISNYISDLNFFRINLKSNNQIVCNSNTHRKTEFNEELSASLFLSQINSNSSFTVIDSENGALVHFTPFPFISSSNSRNLELYIRGIKLDIRNKFNNINNLQMNIQIDILSEKSDKLLTISRNEPRDEAEMNSLLESIYENSTKILFNGLIDESNTCKIENVFNSPIQRFILNYESKIFFRDNEITVVTPLPVNSVDELGLIEVGTSNNFNIDYNEIFSAEIIVHYDDDMYISNNSNLTDKKVLKLVSSLMNSKVFIFDTSKYRGLFRSYYYTFFSNEKRIPTYIRQGLSRIFTVLKRINKEALLEVFELDYYGGYSLDDKNLISHRAVFWILKNNEHNKYSDIKVIDNTCKKLQNKHPNISRIYSPFYYKYKATYGQSMSSYELIEDIKMTIDQSHKMPQRVETIKTIINKHIKNIIPDKLIKYIGKYSASEEIRKSNNSEVIKSKILSTYEQLIFDYLKRYKRGLFLLKNNDYVDLLKGEHHIARFHLKNDNEWLTELYVHKLSSYAIETSDDKEIKFLFDGKETSKIRLKQGFHKLIYNDQNKTLIREDLVIE